MGAMAAPAAHLAVLRRAGLRAAAALACAVAVGVVLLPVAWAVATTFKTETGAVTFPPSLIPAEVTWRNYLRVVGGQNFPTELGNSVLYACGSVVLALLAAAPAGYAAARFRFPGKQAVMMGILATSMIPTVALLVPIYGLLSAHGMLNSRIAIIVIEAARIAPQTVWFIQNFCLTVPHEIEEAASMDGASRMRTFLLIVLPLIKPGLAATVILGLITVWNDYLTVAVFAPDATRRTLQVAVVNQVLDSNGVSWSYMMAFVVVASLPVVLMFLFTQRWFVAGLTAGGVKG